MQEQTSIVKKRGNKSNIITIGVIVLLIAGYITYKIVLTNPLNIDQAFYKEQVYIYKTITKAYEEERPLKEFEETKIETILNKADEDTSPPDDVGKMSEKDFEELQIKGYLYLDVQDMYTEYHFAMEYEGNERKNRLLEFNQSQKVAKAALGLK